jgi:hypothetical protein
MNYGGTLGVDRESSSSSSSSSSNPLSISLRWIFQREWDSDGKSHITFSPNYYQTPIYTRDRQTENPTLDLFPNRLDKASKSQQKGIILGYL